jgi:hypothetical protein
LTSLPVLRYSSGHRKGRLKILSILADAEIPSFNARLGAATIAFWIEGYWAFLFERKRL